MIAISPNTIVPNAINYTPPADALSTDAALLVQDVDIFKPAFPQRIEDLDISATFLGDLALKAVAHEPNCTTSGIASRLHLGLMVTDQILQRLNRDKFIEIKGVVGAHNHRYSMLERGWAEV